MFGREKEIIFHEEFSSLDKKFDFYLTTSASTFSDGKCMHRHILRSVKIPLPFY
jgi:hypothetical protein